MRKKKIYFLLLMAGIFIFLVLSVGYLAFFTTKGSGFVVKYFLSRYTKSSDININKIEGTLSKTLLLQDLSIEKLKGLSQGSVLEVKRFYIHVNPFDLKSLNFAIHNGKLILSTSGQILFYGTYKNAYLDINIYTKSIDVQEIIGLFEGNSALRGIKGTIDDVDIYVKESILEPELKGEFRIKRLSRNGFSVTDCHGKVDLRFKDISANLKIYGEISLNSGVVSGTRTAVVNLQESKIFFDGLPGMPHFDLKGNAVVEGVKIDISVKGTKANPDLNLSSYPPMPKERLLLMLATNKGWKGTEVALHEGQMSPEIAKDFIDYFVFTRSGNRIAEYFGISDISLKYDGETKGVAVRKDISGKAEVSYAVEEPKEKEEKSIRTHKIGSEYKLTDDISIEGKREIKEDKKREEVDKDKLKPKDEVFLKYKKQF